MRTSVGGVISVWGETVKSKTYTFAGSAVDGWSCSPQTTYCTLYYSGKNSAFVVSNKAITDFSDVDFSAVTDASVVITVKGITNSGTNSYTVSLVDKDGNTIGTPQTKTDGLKSSSNKSDATESTVTLTPVAGATGYQISCQAKTALAGTGYKLTYTEVVAPRPTHEVTFSVNGDVSRTATVEEGKVIDFPTAVETTPADATEFPKVINGMTFVGWYGDTYANATTAPDYVSTTTTKMGDADVTYYAVYAEVTRTESEDLAKAELSQTLQYDTWTYSGSTTNKSSYRLFHSNSYIESAAFDLSKLMKVVVYGGTFGGNAYNKLTIGDGTNTWKSVTVSGSSETGTNTYTGGTALSGTKPLRITSNSGSSSSSGVRISKVLIYVKGTIVTSHSFNTTVSTLPRPEITMDDVTMTWGDTDKSVAPMATVSGEAYDGTFSFESSSDDLEVASDGALSCDVPGSYTVTAKIAATGSHQTAEKTCVVTVNRKTPVVSFAETAVLKLLSDDNYTQTATKLPAEAGALTYTIMPSGNDINSSTGEVTLTKTGNYTVTATAAANTLYSEASANYTLRVRKVPTFTVGNQTLAYGETYTPVINGGPATITSNPAGMISIENNTITAATVGTAIVTISTEADDTYVEGERTFTLTVTAPTGLSSVPSPEPVTIFYEGFSKSTGSIESGWAGNSASGTIKVDNTGWLFDSSGNGGAGGAIKRGSGSVSGTATTPSIAVEAGTVYNLTFKAAPWGTETTAMSVTVTGGTISGLSTANMSTKQWNELSATITATASTMKIKFSASQKRFFLDEVYLTRPGESITSEDITVGTSKYASYCYDYPIDLDQLDSHVKAYIVTEVDGTAVTFSPLTGKIKGGVPFILYGAADDYTLSVAEESDVVPAGNKLVGTLAPTYVTTTSGDYTNFGLSGGNFVKINDGVVKAHKAYLPVLTSSITGGARLNIVFQDDDQTTGIGEELMVNSGSTATVYDLQGRRVSHPKTGLYIVNGKKVVIK